MEMVEKLEVVATGDVKVGDLLMRVKLKNRVKQLLGG